jgi:hypothetical protein
VDVKNEIVNASRTEAVFEIGCKVTKKTSIVVFLFSGFFQILRLFNSLAGVNYCPFMLFFVPLHPKTQATWLLPCQRTKARRLI